MVVGVPVACTLARAVKMRTVSQRVVLHVAEIANSSFRWQVQLPRFIWPKDASIWPDMVTEIDNQAVDLAVLKLESSRLI